MPNYSINSLSVTGDSEELRRFRKAASCEENDLSLVKLFPMPETLKDTVAPDDKPNWYDWCVNNWGTKWDVDGKLLQEFEDYLEYSFRSAWNPPIAWLKQVSTDYPTLLFRLRYFEEDDAFTGIARVQNGQIDDRRLDLNVSEDESFQDSLLEAARAAIHMCAMMTLRISSLLPEGR